jgi:hypothetical protein
MANFVQLASGTWRAQLYVNGIRTSKTFRTKREARVWAEIETRALKDKIQAKRILISKVGEDSDILSHQIPVPLGAGIYILFDNGEPVYVGQSRSVISRIAEHARRGRQFTHYHMIPCHPEELDRYEQHYINLLLPSGNKTVISTRQSPPLAELHSLPA